MILLILDIVPSNCQNCGAPYSPVVSVLPNQSVCYTVGTICMLLVSQTSPAVADEAWQHADSRARGSR
jgi:hypothetical protein